MDYYDEAARPNPAAVAASLPLRAFTRLLSLGKADTRAIATALAAYSIAAVTLAELWVRGIVSSAAFAVLPLAGRVIAGISRGTGLLRLAMSLSGWSTAAAGSTSAGRTLGALAAFDGAVCALFLGLAAAKMTSPLSAAAAGSSSPASGWSQHQPPWMWVFVSLWAGSAAVAVMAWLANARQRRRAHRNSSSPCTGFRGEALIYTAQALLTLLFLPLALQLSKAEAAYRAMRQSEDAPLSLPLPWASVVLPWVALPAALGLSSLILLVSLLGTGLNEEAAREAGMETTPEAVLVGILSPSPIRSCAVLSACLWLFGLAAAMVLCLLALEMHLRDMTRAAVMATAVRTGAEAAAAVAADAFAAAEEPQPAARLLMRLGAIFAGFTASVGGYHVLGPLMDHVREQAVREHVEAIRSIKARIRVEPPEHLVRVGDGVFRRLHPHTEALQCVASAASSGGSGAGALKGSQHASMLFPAGGHRIRTSLALTAGGAPLPGILTSITAASPPQAAAVDGTAPAAPPVPVATASAATGTRGAATSEPTSATRRSARVSRDSPGAVESETSMLAQAQSEADAATSAQEAIINGNGSATGYGSGAPVECLICCSCDADAVLLECGHGGVCFGCARRILGQVDASRRHCPLCRVRVTYAARVRPLRQTDSFVLVSLCVTPRIRRWSSGCEEDLSQLPEPVESGRAADAADPAGTCGALRSAALAAPPSSGSGVGPGAAAGAAGAAERAALLAQSLYPGRIPVAVCAREALSAPAQAELAGAAGSGSRSASAESANHVMPAAAALRTSLSPWVSADSGCTCQLVPLQPFAAATAGVGLPQLAVQHPPPPFARRFASTARCRRMHQSDSAIRRLAVATDETDLPQQYSTYWAGVSVLPPHVGNVLYWIGAAVMMIASRCRRNSQVGRSATRAAVATAARQTDRDASVDARGRIAVQGHGGPTIAVPDTASMPMSMDRDVSKPSAAASSASAGTGSSSGSSTGIGSLQSAESEEFFSLLPGAPWSGVAAEVLEVLDIATNPADAALGPSEPEQQVYQSVSTLNVALGALGAGALRITPVPASASAGAAQGGGGGVGAGTGVAPTGIELPPVATGVSATAMRGRAGSEQAGAIEGPGSQGVGDLSSEAAVGPGAGGEWDWSRQAVTPAGAAYSPTAFTGLAAAAAAAAAAAGIHV